MATESRYRTESGVDFMGRIELDFPAGIWEPFATQRPPIRCSAGYLIYLQDTQATCFYYLKSGRIKSFMQSEDGAERILHTYEAGSLFGEASFFDGLPRVSSAVALTPCEIVPIDRELVIAEVSQNPDLALAMLKYLARTVRLLSSQVDDMAFRPVPQRVAKYLLSLSPSGGVVRISQDGIAAAVSASRVSVSRALGHLEEKGWLKRSYGGVTLLHTKELRLFCL